MGQPPSRVADKLASAAIKDAFISREARPRRPRGGTTDRRPRAECALIHGPFQRRIKTSERRARSALGRSSETVPPPRPELGSDSCELNISEVPASFYPPTVPQILYYEAGVR